MISGHLTKVILPAAPGFIDVGNEFWFQVQDNGNGKKGDPDLRSETWVNHLARRQNDDQFLNDCSYDYPLSDASGQKIDNPYGDLFLAGIGNFKVKP